MSPWRKDTRTHGFLSPDMKHSPDLQAACTDSSSVLCFYRRVFISWRWAAAAPHRALMVHTCSRRTVLPQGAGAETRQRGSVLNKRCSAAAREVATHGISRELGAAAAAEARAALLVCVTGYNSSVGAAMAALRRLIPSLTTSSRTSSSPAATALRVVAAGAGVTAAAAAAFYCCSSVGTRSRLRSHVEARLLHLALPSVSATDKARTYGLDDGDVYMSSYENRFRLFSSVEYDGQLYMTPLNFIESVTLNEPKSRRGWRSLTKKELDKMMADTPPVWKGSSNLFRNLRERGVISYTEYLFLLCILTKPHAGFRIAFNMFDADGNEMVDKREFLVLGEIFRKKKDRKEVAEDERLDQQILQLYGHRKSQPHKHVDEKTETTLLVHFFGKKGKAELKFEDFYKFMDNLQTEVLEIEFLSYSKGMPTISEEDFARILLRYTNVDDVSGYLENVRNNIPDEKHADPYEKTPAAPQPP
ncbi:hypothetical protein INR49_028446 [Caranx melampygus]|nr:hypothetical protein INR49_028446 [Caranx melampygus]